MSIRMRIDQIISKLTDARADADKIDAGKSGAPGTRVRKVAQEVKAELDALRRDIVNARGED